MSNSVITYSRNCLYRKRRKQAIKYPCWCAVNFPRDLKCQILSSLTLEIAFKRCKAANIYIYFFFCCCCCFFVLFFLLRNQNNLKLSLLIESL